MPNFTHRISNKSWHEAFLIDETMPGEAYSDVDGEVYRTAGSWLCHYRETAKVRSDTIVERIGYTSLENK